MLVEACDLRLAIAGEGFANAELDYQAPLAKGPDLILKNSAFGDMVALARRARSRAWLARSPLPRRDALPSSNAQDFDPLACSTQDPRPHDGGERTAQEQRPAPVTSPTSSKQDALGEEHRQYVG